MPEYEYKALTSTTFPRSDQVAELGKPVGGDYSHRSLVSLLNDFGKKHWKLKFIYPDGTTMIFMRKLPERNNNILPPGEDRSLELELEPEEGGFEFL